MGTATINLYNEYDSDEVITIGSDDSLTVRDVDTGDETHLQGTSPFVIELDAGQQVIITVTKSGFNTYTSSTIYGSSGGQTVHCYLLPLYRYRGSFTAIQTIASNASAAAVKDAFSVKFYNTQTGVLFDTCHAHNRRGYFWTNSPDYDTEHGGAYSASYIESDKFWPRWQRCNQTAFDSVSFPKYVSLLVPPVYHDVVNDIDLYPRFYNSAFHKGYERVGVSQDYRDDFFGDGNTLSYVPVSSPIQYENMQVAGWLLVRAPNDTQAWKTQVRFQAAPDGYEPSTVIHDLGPDADMREYYTFDDVMLYPPLVWSISPTEGLTGDPLTDYTATVYDSSDNIVETSTDGRFYVAWDGVSQYRVTVTKEGYNAFDIHTTVYPTGMDVTLYPTPVYGTCAVTVIDAISGTVIRDADITYYNLTTETEESSNYLITNYGYQYLVMVEKQGYYMAQYFIAPVSGVDPITCVVELVRDLQYANLRVSVIDEGGAPVTGSTITVHNVTYDADVEPQGDVYPLVYNDNCSFRVTVAKEPYVTYETTLTPTTSDDITLTAVMEMPTAPLSVAVIDGFTYQTITPDSVLVKDSNEQPVTPTGGVYHLSIGETYTVSVTKDGYIQPDTVSITPSDDSPILQRFNQWPLGSLTVSVTNGAAQLDADISVYDLTDEHYITKQNNNSSVLYAIPVMHAYYVEAECEGYIPVTTATDVIRDTTPVSKTIVMELESAPLTVTVTDGTDPLQATVRVTDVTEGVEYEYYDEIPITIGHSYTITASCEGYYTVTTQPEVVRDNTPISRTIVLTETASVLTVSVTDGKEALPATVSVYDQTAEEPITYDDTVQGWQIPRRHEYHITAECDGYYPQTTPTETAASSTIHRTIILEAIPIEEDMLTALKIDLGITATAYDDRLRQYLRNAERAIEKEGVSLDPGNYEHFQLVVMYAGWQWRRRDTGEGMPRMVRYALNNEIFQQHLEK